MFVFRNFPLREMHPNAERAAETAEFAAANDKFWEMHDLLYENQQNLEDESLFGLANQLRLPAEKLREALQTGAYQSRVKADFDGGVRSGVNGTPTFYIDGQRHDGSFDYETLLAAAQECLRAAR